MPNTKETITPALLSDQGVAALLDMSRASVWRRVKDQTLPQPIRIGGLTRWSRAEIEAVIEAALAARDEAAK
jgi:predicted DNA-binding transcriptional regulator AlpA